MRALTNREKQIVKLICLGKANKEIAYELHLSEGTIRQYISHAFRVIGVSNRTSLAMWAVSHGFASMWIGEYEI